MKKIIDIYTFGAPKFVCPKCGGSFFGSSRDIEGKITRHCHGSANSGGCGYEWPEEDDERHA